MSTAPTLQTIADATGYHRMTISRALRDDPSIPAATRATIRAKAEKLGYRPNPLVSALMAQLRTTKKPAYRATLAWLNDYPGKSPWRHRLYMRPYFEGATDRAAELGFQLEEICIPTENVNDIAAHAGQARRILQARGIPGLILPMNYRVSLCKQDWSGFSTAVVGRHKSGIDYAVPGHLPDRIPHSVSEDYYYNMRLACQSLRALGYTRIGWVSNPWFDTMTDSLYSAGFEQEQLATAAENRVPPFLINEKAKRTDNAPDGMKEWATAWRPDVIIGRFLELEPWVKSIGLGKKAPHYAHLGLADDVKGWSGVNPQSGVLGAAAIDMVVAQINRNERETPEHPKELLIRGTWVTGKTTRGLGAK